MFQDFLQLSKHWEFMLIPSTHLNHFTHNSLLRLAHHQVHYGFIKHTAHAPISPTVQDDNAESSVKIHKISNLQQGLGQFSAASSKHHYLLSLSQCVSLLLYYTQRVYSCVNCNWIPPLLPCILLFIPYRTCTEHLLWISHWVTYRLCIVYYVT